MADDKVPLMDKIREGIERSGFPLEMETGNVLARNKWIVRYSPFFFDYEDLRYKEFDILGFRSGNLFETRLFIECKHSAGKQWVFFIPDGFNRISVGDLRFFPLKRDMLFERFMELRNTIFGSIYNYRNTERVALNSAIFRGKEKVESKEIREAIGTTMKALIASNVSDFAGKAKSPFITHPRLNLSTVVFDGPMFVYRWEESGFSLEPANYVLYRHEMRFDTWKHAENIRSEPKMNWCQEYESVVGYDQLIEIVHKDEFERYLTQMCGHLAALDNMNIREFVDKSKEWFDTEDLLNPPWQRR